MMKRGMIMGVIAILAIIALGFIVFLMVNQDNEAINEAGEQQSKTNEENIAESAEQSPGIVTPTAKTHVVKITDSGFSPLSLEIKKEDRVTFENAGTTQSWPASAIHPTHQAYPGSDIKKCGTAEESRIFDSCRGIGKGESWTFTFNEIGSWNYHNHLNPQLRGSIKVSE